MPELTKVLIFGAREWSNWQMIEDLMSELVRKYGTTNLLIIAGHAPGADVMAEETAYEWDVHCASVKALWGTRHRAAGPQRNRIMELMKPDEAYGFHNNIKKSKGTANMKRRLEKLGIPCEIRKERLF